MRMGLRGYDWMKELYEAGLRILRQILNRLKFGLIF